MVGIERCEAHDKKRQDEKDKDESPECVNNTHGQRDGQGACEKMKMVIFLHFFAWMILASALHGLDYCDFQPPHLSPFSQTTTPP